MATVVNDLVTKFSFLGSIKPLSDYNDSLGGSLALLGGMGAALNAGASAFAYWADGVLGGVDALDALSRQTEVSVAAIQELNFIAEQTQSTTGAMEASIASLTDTIGSAAQKGSEDFARLGISVRNASGEVKSADEVLEEVRQRFGQLNISLKEQKHFAKALGIDASLIQMLNKTSEEMSILRDRARELGTLTAEQTEQANEYKKSMNALWFGLNSVKQLIAIGVSPELSRMAENFTQLLVDNKDWIVEGIQFSIEWIGNLTAAFNRLLPAFALMTAGFVGMKIAALGFGTVMGVILSPLVLITAGIVAMLLVVDDLIVAFQGGNSVIAAFFKDTFDIDIVDTMTNAFQSLMQFGINPLIDGIKLIWSGWSALVGLLWKGGAIVFKALGITADDATDTRTRANMDIPQGSTAGARTQVDNRQVNQDNTIQIFTNDPDAAGRAVGDTLQRQLDNANTQLAPGGR